MGNLPVWEEVRREVSSMSRSMKNKKLRMKRLYLVKMRMKKTRFLSALEEEREGVVGVRKRKMKMTLIMTKMMTAMMVLRRKAGEGVKANLKERARRFRN